MKVSFKIENFFVKNTGFNETNFKRVFKKKLILSNMSATFEFLDQIVGMIRA